MRETAPGTDVATVARDATEAAQGWSATRAHSPSR